MPRLKVATFNTWNCQGRFDCRQPLMVEGLRALDADVLLLQEVFSQAPGGFDFGRCLAQDLGLHIASVPARKKLRKFNKTPLLSHSGLAVLAKTPVRPVTTVPLPEDRHDGERLGQIARLDWQGLNLVIANVHLSHLADADDLRRRQLMALLGRVPVGYDLLVLGGDMNMDTAHADLAKLRQDYGFAQAAFGPGAHPQSTLNPIARVGPHGGVIDHLFVKAAADHRVCAHARLALDEADPKHGIFPSDHKGLVAEVLCTFQPRQGYTHDTTQSERVP